MRIQKRCGIEKDTDDNAYVIQFKYFVILLSRHNIFYRHAPDCVIRKPRSCMLEVLFRGEGHESWQVMATSPLYLHESVCKFFFFF